MRRRAFHQSLRIEEKRLRRLASEAGAIKDHEACRADEHVQQFKLQIRHARQRRAPINFHLCPALQLSRRFAGELHDERRVHLEVFRVMLQHPRQIMGVPRLDPVVGELVGKFVRDCHKMMSGCSPAKFLRRTSSVQLDSMRLPSPR